MPNNRTGLKAMDVAAIVAAVALVTIIMVPIIANSRAKSRLSSCQANMLRIAAAVQQYARDNNGHVPPSQFFSKDAKTSVASYAEPAVAPPGASDEVKSHYPSLWTGRLMSYLKNDRHLFICPLVDEANADGHFYRPSPSKSDSPWTTYGMNWRFSNGGALGGEPLDPKEGYAGLVQTLDSPPVPSQTVLLIETQQKPAWTGSGTKPFTGEIAVGGNITPFKDTGPYFWAIRWLGEDDFTPYGHNSGCNAVLADGHVTFISAPAAPYPPKASEVELAGFVWW